MFQFLESKIYLTKETIIEVAMSNLKKIVDILISSWIVKDKFVTDDILI